MARDHTHNHVEYVIDKRTGEILRVTANGLTPAEGEELKALLEQRLGAPATEETTEEYHEIAQEISERQRV